MFINQQYQFGFSNEFSESLWYLCDLHHWPTWSVKEHRAALKASLSY